VARRPPPADPQHLLELVRSTVPPVHPAGRPFISAGLAIASDIGILIQTLTLAILLDRRRMVPLRGLEYPELMRSLLAAVASYAALVGLRTKVSYEAQAAIELEMAAHDSADEGAYLLNLIPMNSGWQIGTRSLFDWLIADIEKGTSVPDMSRRFHNGLVAVLVELAEKIRAQRELSRVCLSGGCFQNVLLFESLLAALRKQQFEVYFHSEVPAGDGGLSLGQALVAAHIAKANAKNG